MFDQFILYVSGKPIEPSAKYIIREANNKLTLIIKDVGPDDEAVYTLTVGNVKSSAELVVEG